MRRAKERHWTSHRPGLHSILHLPTTLLNRHCLLATHRPRHLRSDRWGGSSQPTGGLDHPPDTSLQVLGGPDHPPGTSSPVTGGLAHPPRTCSQVPGGVGKILKLEPSRAACALRFCQNVIGSAPQQATGLAAGSRPRAKQLYCHLFNNMLGFHRQSSVRTHGYNK